MVLSMVAPGQQKESKIHIDFSLLSEVFAIHKSEWTPTTGMARFENKEGLRNEGLEKFVIERRKTINPGFEGDLPFNKINFFKLYVTAFKVLEKLHMAANDCLFGLVRKHSSARC